MVNLETEKRQYFKDGTTRTVSKFKSYERETVPWPIIEDSLPSAVDIFDKEDGLRFLTCLASDVT